MPEQYRKNVQAMCDRLGLPNPIQDKHVLIYKVEIYRERIGEVGAMSIESTDMNRAGMVFLQEQFSPGGILISAAKLGESFQTRAREHFAEIWLDAYEKNRTLVKALMGAYHIKVYWRSTARPK